MYDDDESGHPLEPAGATQWYWAMQHANSDAARACPSRRMAQWITQSGQKAFLYYWTYVPDASGMCGHGACHCAELPFVWHVLSGASAPLLSLSLCCLLCSDATTHTTHIRAHRPASWPSEWLVCHCVCYRDAG